MRKKGTRQEWDRVRAIAANMLDAGKEPAEIAPQLGVAAQTVREWRRAYRKGGRGALASRKPPGRPGRLSESQREELAALLLKAPAECGFDRYLWTQQLIADLVAREFGVRYHHDHVGVILKGMGFTHQKPARRARAPAGPALLKKVPAPGA
jgi:transposase